ncbi:MAG: autotransporter-associated beta strand repeat-containing protein [Alphaproteobacteria bacterium]|nr:autotransporter-associated beta strand repeat-containing protein [Alphaproteobacteria bacterium]
MSNETLNRAGFNLSGALRGKSRFSHGLSGSTGQRITLTLAAAMLAGTALVPAAAQTFDVNGAVVVVNNFVDPPLNNPATILNNDAVNLGTLNVEALTSLSFGGNLTAGAGVLALTKTGAESLTLSGNNSFTGQTSVLGGTLVAGSNTALSSGSSLLVSTLGTLDLAGTSNSIPVLNGNGTIINTGPGAATLTITGAVDGNFAGTIFGDTALVKTGAAAQSLRAASSFTGGVTLQQGALRIADGAALGVGALTVTGNGTLATLAGADLVATNLVSIGAATQLTVATAGGAAGLSLGGVISGDGSLRKEGTNALQLNGANSFAGGVVLAGGTLLVGSNSALGLGAAEVAATSTLGQSDGSVSLTLGNDVLINAGLTLLTPNVGQTFTLSGNLTANAPVTIGAGNGGTVALTGMNGFGGQQLRVDSGRLQIDAPAAIADAVLRFAGGTALDVTDASPVTLANGLTLNGTTTLTHAGSLQLSGLVAGAGSLVKASDGTLFLTRNVNSLTGEIDLNAGRLEARLGTSLGSGMGSINAANGTTLAIGNPVPSGVVTSSDRVITIATGGTMTLNLMGDSANFFLNDADGAANFDGTDLTLNGAVTGGTLNISGSGRVRLNSASTLEGLGIDQSAVVLGNAGALGGGALRVNEGAVYASTGNAVTLNQNIVVSNNFFIVGSDNVTINGVVSSLGAVPTELGAIIKIGTGTLRLNGANTMDNVRLQDGRVVVGTNTALGQRDFNTSNFAGTSRTLEAGVDGLQLANNVSLVGPLSIDTAGNTLTLTGQVFNTGSLVKAGAGTLVLTGDNIYGGPTTINAGTLAAGSDTAFATGIVTVANGATLSSQTAPAGGTRTIANNIVLNNGSSIDSNGNLFVLSGLLTGAGTTSKLGAGTLHITGNSSNLVTGFTGLIDVQDGELRLNGSIAGGITAQATATVTGTGSAGGTVTLNNSSVLAPGNSPGTITFGSLVLANNTALNFELAGLAAVPGTDADLVVVTNNLTLDGVLNITPLTGFNVGTGARTLMTYGNLVANNGVTVSNAPPVDVTYSVASGPVASGAGIVQLLVGFTGTYRWDGANLTPNGVIDGGAGTLNLTNTNFTNSDGTFNLAYGNLATDDIQFGGTAGGVDVASAINFDQMSFVTTGYTLGGVGSLNANNSGINVGGNTATINTNITGGSLVKTGTGNLVLGGNNSNASFAVDAGTVTAASDTALGAGTATFAGGTTLAASGSPRTLGNAIVVNAAGGLTVDAVTNTLSLNGIVSGTGPLNLTSSGGAIGGRDGVIVLAGVNTFTGGVNIAGTTAVINANSGLGDVGGNVLMNNGELRTTTSFATGRGFTLNGVGSTFNVDAGTVLTVNGLVNGSSSLEKTGTGTLVLANAGNLYNGGTQINAGTVSVASNGALGALGGVVSFTGSSTLQFTADVTSARDVVIASAVTGTIDTQGNDVRLDGNIVDAGTLAKIGAGRLTLTGNNSYAGGTNLDVGTLRIEDGQSIGSGRLTTQGGTTFVAGLGAGAGTIALSNNITLAGGQTTIDLNGNFLFINPVTGAVSTNGTNLVLNGTITGPGGFTTSNLTSGQIVIGGNNDFTGNVNLNSAVVVVNNDNALGTGNTVNINSAAGIRNNSGGTTRTIGSAVAINDPNATVGGNGNITLTGVVSGASTNVFNKVGLGTVTLANAANTIASQIEVAQGELAVTGTLTDANQLTTVRAGATLSGTGTIAGVVDVVNSAVLSAGVGGNGQVGRLTIGTLLLNEQSSLVFDLGDNYVNGGPLNDQITTTNLRLGGRLTVRESTGGSFGLGVYNLFTYQGALLAGSTGVQVLSLPGAFSGLVQTLVPGQVNLVVTQPGTFVQYWDGADTAGNGAVNGGAGTWSATGSNWTGLPDSQLNTNWFNNSVAVFGGTAGTVTLAQLFQAQGLQFVTSGYTLSGGILDNQSSGVGTGMFAHTDTGVTATINSVIQGDGILFKQGAGTLALGGNNVNFSGGTQVQAGTLQLNHARGAGTGAIALLGNTTLSSGPASLIVANAISTTGSNTIDNSLSASLTLTGVISGTGSIVKTGAGLVTLSGINSYSGGTSLNVGSLAVTNNSSIGTGALTLNAGTSFVAAANGLVFNNAVLLNTQGTIDTQGNNLTLSGVISDGTPASGLRKLGTGNLNLQGVNTYTGGTAVVGGSITVFNNSSVGTGGMTMLDATGLIAGANGITLLNNISTFGAVTVDTAANTLTLNGAVAGPGSLIKIGSGDLTLNSSTSSYGGGTALQAGSITVGSNAALGTGGLVMTGGTTLNAGAAGLALANAVTTLGAGTVNTNAFTFTLGGAIDGVGSIVKIGSGNLVLNGGNSHVGGTNVTAGTVTAGNNAAFGTGTVTMADGTTLANNANNLNVGNAFSIGNVTVATGANTFTLSGPVNGGGLLTKTGAGNLILSGSNGYAGGTALTEGSLTITNNNSIGTGTLTTTGGTTLVAGINDPSTGLVINLANAISLGAGLTTIDLQGTFSGAQGNGNILFDGAALVLAGPITGAGGLRVTDEGRLFLNGNNSFQGGVTLSGAVLNVGTDSALGTGDLTVNTAGVLSNTSGALRTLANNVVMVGTGALNVAGPDDITLNGVVSGNNSLLNKSSANTLTLNGANTHIVTSLGSGRITIGNNAALGTFRLNVLDHGLPTILAAGVDGLVVNTAVLLQTGTTNLIVESGAGNFTLNGLISGTGALTKVQSGNLVLNGANSYSGGTAINAGTVTVGNNTALGSNTVTMANGTTLANNANNLVVANQFSIGNVTVATGANTFTLSNTVSGTGSITKTGSGNLILNGANSYTLGTALTAGTITVGTNGALGTGRLTASDATSLVAGVSGLNVANNVTLNGGLTVDSGTGSFELSGVIDGTGSITKVNSGTLILSGVNSYSGGTNLNTGSLTIGNGGALGSGPLNTAGGTTLVIGTTTGTNTAITLGNPINLGAGITTLDLQGTSLSFNNDASIITNGAALTLNGVVSGAGGLATGNFGTVTLNGNNSYRGGTQINSRSVVYVGSDTAVGTGTVTMGGATGLYNVSGATRTLANNFVLNGGSWLGGTSDLVLNGTISGTGPLLKAGPQTLVLNGANSYTGNTQLRDGRITVGTNSALGTGILTVVAPIAVPAAGFASTLAAGSAGLALANDIVLNTDSSLTVESGAGSFTLAGVISGAGRLTKVQSGTLVLNGVNSFGGGTTLSAGTIQVGTSSALGTGGLALGAGTTLQAGAADLALTNGITTTGFGSIDTQGLAFTLAGVIDGVGSINKIGSGNLILTGNNGYRGGTSLAAGTITVGTSTALGAGQLTMAGGTTLVAGADTLVLANGITTQGVGTVNSNGFGFTLNGVIDGAGSLAKIGAGTLVLNGTNAYTGGTNVAAGTVTAGTNTAFGTGTVTLANATIVNTNASNLVFANAFSIGNATVDSGATSVTLNGVVSGAGQLTKVGSGTLILNAANSYTGGTALNAGTVRVGNAAALGTGSLAMAAGTTLQAGAAALTLANAIGMAGGATVDVNGQVFTLGGVISGTGPLSVIDSQSLAADALILTGTNTYTGGTIVTGTTLQVSADANLGNVAGGLTLVGGTLRTTASFTTARTVALGAGGGTVETATGTTLTSTGVVSGTSLTKTGAGTLALSGVNTYTGGTALNAGQITVGANAALGTGTLTMAGGTTLAAGVTGINTANSIVTLAAATINSGATPSVYTISGVISGAGSVTKQGTGVLTVSAANTFTGGTTVAAGTLNVTGSLASGVTVNSGAALTGTGSMASLNVLAGGSVNPGAPGTTDVATLTVTGAATLAGTYTVNVTPSTNDRLNAGGVLTLGGTLAVAPTVPANFATFNQVYTVATGASRTGTFATATGLDQFGLAFAPVVEYTTTAATIRLAPQSLVTLGNRFGGVTGNALEVAQAFDRAVAAGYNPQAFFNVYANGGSNLPRTLREMSGEQRATERRVVLDSNRTIREAALDRLNAGVASMGGQQVSTSDGDRSLTFWLRGAGSWGKAQNAEAATAFTSEQRGILTGLDWKKDGITIGGMFHYTTTDVEYRFLGGSSNVETTGGTLYAGYRKDGGIVVNAGASLAGSRSNGARTISLPTFQQVLQGRTTGTTYGLFGELAWDLAASADTRIEPFARLSHVKADFGGLVETGGVAALTAAKQASDVTITNLGMRFGANVASGKVALNASASWQGTSGDRDALTVIGIPAVGQNGNIRSVLMDRQALSMQADAAINLSDTIRFSLGYSGLVGKRNDDHGARATLNFAF